jgi:hypothetical protein
MDSPVPEIVLNCARVIAYAIVDDSVTFIERGNFFVDGKLLGAVPRLAICQNVNEDDIMIFHCDNKWNVLGVAGGNASVEEAKQWAERSYKGLMNKWVPTGTTEEEVIAYLDDEFANEKCSFCGKWPLDVELMIGEKVRICNFCVDKFYEILHNADEGKA